MQLRVCLAAAVRLGHNQSARGNAGEAHPWNGRIKNTNVLFGDGHVETRKALLIQMRYRGNYYNFY